MGLATADSIRQNGQVCAVRHRRLGEIHRNKQAAATGDALKKTVTLPSF
jgi:hypothetical protein